MEQDSRIRGKGSRIRKWEKGEGNFSLPVLLGVPQSQTGTRFSDGRTVQRGSDSCNVFPDLGSWIRVHGSAARLLDSWGVLVCDGRLV